MASILEVSLENIFYEIQQSNADIRRIKKLANQKGIDEDAKTDLEGQIAGVQEKINRIRNSLKCLEYVIYKNIENLIEGENERELEELEKVEENPLYEREELQKSIDSVELPRRLRKKYGNAQAFVSVKKKKLEAEGINQRAVREVETKLNAKDSNIEDEDIVKALRKLIKKKKKFEKEEER